MKRVWLFRILTVLYLAAVAVLCFAYFPQLSTAPRTIFGIESDKLVHFFMFLPFPVLVFFSFNPKRQGLVKTLIMLVLIFAAGCGIAWGTEYIQGHLPYRTMDPSDFSADRLGLICGTLAAFLIQLFVRKKKHA